MDRKPACNGQSWKDCLLQCHARLGRTRTTRLQFVLARLSRGGMHTCFVAGGPWIYTKASARRHMMACRAMLRSCRTVQRGRSSFVACNVDSRYLQGFINGYRSD
mmetsp:Transcript_40779/g.71624  ORF Transcript_40779/g.71624 Transcript_40779/m.71624 type:complete len:105 (+) Transcript_40779:69-383(+)